MTLIHVLMAAAMCFGGGSPESPRPQQGTRTEEQAYESRERESVRLEEFRGGTTAGGLELAATGIVLGALLVLSLIVAGIVALAKS